MTSAEQGEWRMMLAEMDSILRRSEYTVEASDYWGLMQIHIRTQKLHYTEQKSFFSGNTGLSSWYNAKWGG